MPPYRCRSPRSISSPPAGRYGNPRPMKQMYKPRESRDIRDPRPSFKPTAIMQRKDHQSFDQAASQAAGSKTKAYDDGTATGSEIDHLPPVRFSNIPLPPGDNTLYTAAKHFEYAGNNMHALALYYRAMLTGDRPDSSLKDIAGILNMLGKTQDALDFLHAHKAYIFNSAGWVNLVKRLQAELDGLSGEQEKRLNDLPGDMPRCIKLNISCDDAVNIGFLDESNGQIPHELLNMMFPNIAKLRQALLVDEQTVIFQLATHSAARKAMTVLKWEKSVEDIAQFFGVNSVLMKASWIEETEESIMKALEDRLTNIANAAAQANTESFFKTKRSTVEIEAWLVAFAESSAFTVHSVFDPSIQSVIAEVLRENEAENNHNTSSMSTSSSVPDSGTENQSTKPFQIFTESTSFDGSGSGAVKLVTPKQRPFLKKKITSECPVVDSWDCLEGSCGRSCKSCAVEPGSVGLRTPDQILGQPYVTAVSDPSGALIPAMVVPLVTSKMRTPVREVNKGTSSSSQSFETPPKLGGSNSGQNYTSYGGYRRLADPSTGAQWFQLLSTPSPLIDRAKYS